MTESQPNPKATSIPATTAGAARAVTSTDLFQGERSIVISHSGEQYRLMITRNDKLILQK